MVEGLQIMISEGEILATKLVKVRIIKYESASLLVNYKVEIYRRSYICNDKRWHSDYGAFNLRDGDRHIREYFKYLVSSLELHLIALSSIKPNYNAGRAITSNDI